MHGDLHQQHYNLQIEIGSHNNSCTIYNMSRITNGEIPETSPFRNKDKFNSIV